MVVPMDDVSFGIRMQVAAEHLEAGVVDLY
jgi:hypothetical protein